MRESILDKKKKKELFEMAKQKWFKQLMFAFFPAHI